MAITSERFDRQVKFFGDEGQRRLSAASVAVVGVGGLGSHVVQQLAFLGVYCIAPIDAQDLEISNRNRLIGARWDDPIPGTKKVDIAERLALQIDPNIKIKKVYDSLVSEHAFATVVAADYVIGCVDSEGARLILTELSAAYSKPYIDLASDIVPEQPMKYGGQVCIAWNGNGCLSCLQILDNKEAESDLAGPEERQRRNAAYGVDREVLNEGGPSVVTINGVVASLGVTEFMLGVTGLRDPRRSLRYDGNTGKVLASGDAPTEGCYFCKGLRGKGDTADVQRYIRDGIGEFLR